MSRVVVVDDHPVFRRGLVALLRSAGHDVVGEAGDGQEAVAVAEAERPDVVVMDLSMPMRDGFEATAYLCSTPGGPRVVVITLFDDESSVARALEAGASGYVSKQAEPEEILGAIDAAVRGAQWIGVGVARPPLTTAPGDELSALTPRERLVADLLSRGHTNRQIADQLVLSSKTVANYVASVLVKLGVADRDEAIRVVRRARGG